MKLTKLAIGLAAVLTFSAQANADQTFNLGALAAPSSAAIAGNVGAGAFTDYFDFSVPNSIVNSVITSVSLFGYTGISNLDIALYSGTTLLAPGYQATTPLSPGVVVSAATTLPYTLTAGSYSLHVTGSGLAGGGSFGGNLNVAAVPEPGEGALLLSGLGLMGFIAARRSRKA